MHYSERLKISATEQRSNLCMGWDPDPQRWPQLAQGGALSLDDFLTEVVQVLQSSKFVPAAFKVNPGYFLRFDSPLQADFRGSLALARLLKLLRKNWTSNPVIFDAKRGDIDRSSANYAQEAFQLWQADAATLSPYMGSDALTPFLSYAQHGHAVYVLLLTSNPSAQALQQLDCGGKTFYRRVFKELLQSGHQGLAAVVGATKPAELSKIASLAAELKLPLLIPGVGSQGGDLRTTLDILQSSGYPLELARINMSRALLQPWTEGKAPVNWTQLIAKALEETGSLMADYFPAHNDKNEK